MKTKFLLLPFLVFLFACGPQQSEEAPTNTPSSDTPELETTTLSDTETPPEPIIEPAEKKEKGQDDNAAATDKGIAVYNGSWFSVKHPADFKTSPTEPVTTMTEDHHGEPLEEPYSFITTDEATFTSPDGKVEFFVYSPQWGGYPESYMNAASNEKTTSDQTKRDKDPEWGRTHRWVSFEDKDGKYKRAFHSMKTESTHLVFGIKYTDQAAYDTHKEAYLAFKKSLVQYAD